MFANSANKSSTSSNHSPSLRRGQGEAHKEQQKRLRKAERAVEDSENKIARMEQRLKELDQLLMDPEKASDMVLVTEYTDVQRQLDEEVERWEQLSEELEEMRNEK